MVDCTVCYRLCDATVPGSGVQDRRQCASNRRDESLTLRSTIRQQTRPVLFGRSVRQQGCGHYESTPVARGARRPAQRSNAPSSQRVLSCAGPEARRRAWSRHWHSALGEARRRAYRCACFLKTYLSWPISAISLPPSGPRWAAA